MTDADRPAEAPPARPPRPAVLTLTQSVLALEAFAAIFAILALWGLGRGGAVDAPAWLVFGCGPVLVIAMLFAAARQSRRWGRALGWAVQLPLLLAGLVESAIAIIGGLFLVMWLIALQLGTRIDRERAEHAAAEASTDEGERS